MGHRIGKRLSIRYAEDCNAPSAERCIKVGMAIVKYAVLVGQKKVKKEREKYLVNWGTLNKLCRRWLSDRGEYPLGRWTIRLMECALRSYGKNLPSIGILG